MREVLSDVLHKAIRNGLAEVHTALPAEILAFEPGERKAEVRPLLKRRLPNGEEQSLPVISDVPVMFPAANGRGITWPLEKGDKVLLFFTERSIDQWLDSGDELTPRENRRFDLSDAVVVPGLYPFTDGPVVDEDALNVRYKGGYATIEDGIVTLGNETDTVKVEEGTVTAGNDIASLKIDGGTVALGTSVTEVLDTISSTLQSMSTHTHSSFGAPPNEAAAMIALKTQIDLIKGSL